MGLFSRSPLPVDVRDRDYVLTRCPVVAADDLVVSVDLTLRIAVQHDGRRPFGYSVDEEAVVHAVVVLLVRQHAATLSSTELMTDRAGIVAAVEAGLGLAPVGAFTEPRVTAVEVRAYERDPESFRHVFRVVG